jgi:hypothetical protein
MFFSIDSKVNPTQHEQTNYLIVKWFVISLERTLG